MNLKEFLLTADVDHNIALHQARDHTTIDPVFITSNTLTVYVVQAGLYTVFSDVAADASSPVRGICMALMDRLRGQSEFNLSSTLPLGQANIAMLNVLIAALPDHAAAITGLRDTLIPLSSKANYPFTNVTLHDVLIARDSCPAKSVTASGGYVTITTTADCPLHNPRLMALNPRTGRTDILGNVRISSAGVYEFKIPTHYLQHTNYTIDDAYGVI
jgi:hypothetical protein